MNFIIPNWQVPKNIKAYTTIRKDGISKPPYDSLNLGNYCGDDQKDVIYNRNIVKKELNLKNEPIWLNQQHSNIVIDGASPYTLESDGSYTNQSNITCAILTADCLPVLLCNDIGTEIAAIHSGWKGLSKGILENGIKKFKSKPKNIIAWLGPSICMKHYEVKQDLFNIFTQNFKNFEWHNIFKQIESDKYLLNISAFAIQFLRKLGVANIYNSNLCTFCDKENFYSYRRDGITGRIANLIWIE